ncbi:EndoU domain-containing protein [Prescottella defluvii]|uniref:EndoU domain-containing protein n=1 Tax=Prescottella defluvii TaxID=1323361 RepID=UPI0004F3B4FE|nr:EndoU domain-containing protein [Prescottella defluvii]
MSGSAAERIATLEYAVGPRRGIVHTHNPAHWGASGAIRPDWMSAPHAAAVESAASAFRYSDACALWRHLAQPVSDRIEITRCNDDALVASPDPDVVYHVTGIPGIWHQGRDPRHYTAVPAREVLDELLDRLDDHSGLLDARPASAHAIWDHLAESREQNGPPVSESIGPYTGWRLIPGTRVRVEPLGRNNFRDADRVAAIRSVIASAGGTVAEWCDAHDALLRPSGVGSDLDADDRRLVRELFLDLVLWQAGRTSVAGTGGMRHDSLGVHRPAEVDVMLLGIGADPDGRKLFIGAGRDGFEFAAYAADAVPGAAQPVYRLLVSHARIRTLCDGWGAPSHAHPLPVVSLFADEIGELGPREWLRRNGVDDWAEEHPEPVVTPSSRELAEQFAATLYRPPAGGHGAGVGLPGKTEFPATWSRETVMERIESTTVEPLARTVIGCTVFDEREFDGVWICVVWRRRPDSEPQVVTAYPLSGDGVVFNELPDDYPRNLVLPAATDLSKAVDSAPDELVRLVRNAVSCGEPYEAILAGLHIADSHRIALPLSLMNTIAQLIFDRYFDDADYAELTDVFTTLAERDHPESTWGPVGWLPE